MKEYTVSELVEKAKQMENTINDIKYTVKSMRNEREFDLNKAKADDRPSIKLLIEQYEIQNVLYRQLMDTVVHYD